MKFSFKKALCLFLTVCIMCSTFALPVFANTEEKNTTQIAEGLTAEKLCSLRQSHTINPGRDITYSIRIENATSTEQTVTITDVIPEVAEYKKGCENISDGVMTWTTTVPADGSMSIQYSITVKNDNSLLGQSVEGGNAKVNGISVDCYDIYIENTFGEVDNKKIISSIDTLNTALVTDTELAKTIYNNATSFNFTMDEDSAEVLEQIYVTGVNAGAGSGSGGAEEMPAIVANYMDMIAPTLYGGTTVHITPNEYFRGEPNPNPTKEDLMIGDLLFLGSTSSANVYIYNGDQLVKLDSGNFKEVVREDANAVLARAVASEKYIVLRPSFVLTTYHQSTPEFDENLSDAQKAVIYTALAYQRRGYRVQYADSVMNLKEYRWQHSVNSPESYTQDNIQYTNCAAFCNDVYINSIGYNEEAMYRTDLLNNCKKTVWRFTRTATQEHSAEEKAQVEKEFYDTLQPGDIINIRYTTSSGHAMLYVGNGTIIHSAGSKISYGQVDTIETSIKVMRVAELWTPDNRRYIFSKCSSINIVRPLMNWNGEIPQNTKNRITTMMGIVGEKLSSKNEYTSVNPGDEITYTFSVYNTNEEAKTLEILDTVPVNTSFVSGDLENDNGNLSRSLTVGANETKTVSYTVKVNEDAPCGTRIVSNSATIGGVIHPTHEILVAKTLTDAQQTQITTAYNNNKSTLSGVALANKIYKDVLGVEKVIHHDTVEDILGNLTRVVSNGEVIDGVTVKITDTYANDNYFFELDKSYYKDMVVPKFMNGRYVFSTQNHSDLFTRLPREVYLIPGDIIVSKTKYASTTTLYMYSKEGLINLSNKTIDKTPDVACQKLLGNKCFVLLRPSMANSYEYTEPEISPLEIYIEELKELNKSSISDDATLAVFEAKVAEIDTYLAENTDEALTADQLVVYNTAIASIKLYKDSQATPGNPEEGVIRSEGKVWFNLNGNSRLFVKSDSTIYTNRTTYKDFLPGVDFAGTIRSGAVAEDYTPTGDFATDQADIVYPLNGGAMFVYTLDKNNASPGKYTIPDFTTGEDGNIYWEIFGVKYLIQPNKNVIKNLSFKIPTSSLTDTDMIARYKSLNTDAVIDVPDGKYESVGILVGAKLKFSKAFSVSLYYEGEEAPVVVSGDDMKISLSTATSYKEGTLSMKNFLHSDPNNDSAHYFVPKTIEADSSKVLTKISVKDTSVTNNRQPLYVISAWGVEKDELSGEISLEKNTDTETGKITSATTNVTIKNPFGSAGKIYTLIIACYDENNNFCGMKTMPNVTTEGEKEITKSLTYQVPSNTVTVKAFLWKDLTTMAPLAECK